MIDIAGVTPSSARMVKQEKVDAALPLHSLVLAPRAGDPLQFCVAQLVQRTDSKYA